MSQRAPEALSDNVHRWPVAANRGLEWMSGLQRYGDAVLRVQSGLQFIHNQSLVQETSISHEALWNLKFSKVFWRIKTTSWFCAPDSIHRLWIQAHSFSFSAWVKLRWKRYCCVTEWTSQTASQLFTVTAGWLEATRWICVFELLLTSIPFFFALSTSININVNKRRCLNFYKYRKKYIYHSPLASYWKKEKKKIFLKDEDFCVKSGIHVLTRCSDIKMPNFPHVSIPLLSSSHNR